ncbi:ABC transporter ATP-binding protein [Roseococcus sp. SDR]|uniref:ABC transporter ATP-binding protein n=1 Tax=Roseococcus sp. SDR TaxID=2835532 RepID=UPI001BD0A001|nr:ABC transporter ATP-binding protein [Roseococcus sp. SDR]MBS7789022.1 ABC transporter ATP-binding protein [Roseococcus sp. SDR]MBV1844336.1 ABC transporter ATP-binding protein [Roseococcus sp. SDR]
MLEARDLAVGHGRRKVLSGLNLHLRAGELLCLLGPNGGGKTTLLRTLLGLIPPLGGTVLLEGQPLTRLSRRAVAQRLAYVPQAAQGGFAYPARAVVAMGRAAHLGLFAAPGAADHAAAEAALDRLSIAHLADRPVTELSGGERQLVLVARALAQGGRAIILDEPTASLDFGNQALVLREVRALARRDGLAVLMTTHQPDHALLLADAVMLVAQGGAQGPAPPEALITPETLRAAYGVEAAIGTLGARRVVAPLI